MLHTGTEDFIRERHRGVQGNGPLYTVYDRVVEQHVNAHHRSPVSDGSVTTQVGTMYIDPPKEPYLDRPVSNFRINIQIWGKGVDPSQNTGDRPNPKTQLLTMDVTEFQELLEPVLEGIDVHTPGNQWWIGRQQQDSSPIMITRAIWSGKQHAL